MKYFDRIAPAAVALMLACGPVAAQSKSEPTAEMQASHSFSKPSDALANAIETLDWEWKYAPLAFTAATFVVRPGASYGTYEIRRSSQFAAGEPLLIYLEPVGFEYGRDGSAYLIDLATDIEIVIPSGQVIVTQPDFARISARAGKPIKEFSANLALNAAALKPGEYVLRIVFRDLHSTKSAEVTLPFSVVGPQAD